MKLVTTQSEQALVDMLQHIGNDPGKWMSLHINIAPLHQQMMEQEGLSKAVLAKIHKISEQIAQKLLESGLDTLDGQLMVFEDSDVLALFQKKSDSLPQILDGVRSEFTKSGMIHLLTIEEMQDKLAQVVLLSKDKKLTAEDQRLKRQAVEVGENFSEWSGPDPELTEAIQRKRRARSSGTVLIIEDDVMVRGLLATMLKGDHLILQAKNAQSGIIAYIDKAPNVVFLDIHMPGLDGHDTLRRLRQIDPEAYVIMLSGDSSSNNILSAQSQGAAGFVRKPFTKEKLLQYINICPSLQPKNLAKSLGWYEMKKDPRNK
jgi:CheY-like chemotaxis protein